MLFEATCALLAAHVGKMIKRVVQLVSIAQAEGLDGSPVGCTRTSDQGNAQPGEIQGPHHIALNAE